MPSKVIQYVFFANYFIGILAIALALETTFQLALPFNSIFFYIFLFAATVLFYTRAYLNPSPANTSNPRTNWYRQHHRFAVKSLWFFWVLCLTCIIIEWYRYGSQLAYIPLYYWFLIVTVPLAALLYYGIWPKAMLQCKLRNIGWLKPFVIGYVWAGTVSALPVIVSLYENKTINYQPVFMLWLFIKNWMFCAVNAVMFDIKDYAEDANRDLKTFVVRVGLQKTIWLILFPLLLLGFTSFAVFAFYSHFGFVTILLNAVPFVCMLYVAIRLNYQKNILYYLIVIDGLLLVKAICGISAVLLQ